MAGRPKSTTASSAIKKTEIKEAVKPDAIETSQGSLEKENELLKKQMEELIKKMSELKKQNTLGKEENVEVTSDQDDFVDINPLKPIKVISLNDGGVNLKTSNDGNAKTFRLDKFGHTVTITYSDLQDVIATCRSFIENGTVYICDKDVVRNNYLQDCYQHFLSVNTISNILTFPVDKIIELVSNTTPAIQETIIALLVKKINSNEYVDMNKVDAIGKACTPKCDITSLALQKRSE